MRFLALFLSLLFAGQVAGQAEAPPAPQTLMPATIMQIQGAEQFSPLKGHVVQTSGVVTLLTTKKDGFWIQDPAGDGDPATSDGLFVAIYAGLTVPAVSDAVKVVGRVQEEQVGKGNELPRTLLVDVQRLEVVSKGNPLPKPVPLTKLPDVSIAEGIKLWESLEGMRVSLEDAPVISPTNRFREFDVLAPGNAVPGSGFYPQSGRLLVRNLGEGGLVDNNPERIMIGDATVDKQVAVSAGDRLTSLVGVVDYTFGYFKVQPEPGSVKVVAQPIPKPPVSVRTGPAGNLTITTFNLWDFFSAVPKGKNNSYVLKPDELEKRIAKIAQAVVTELKLPQIIAVQELEAANLAPVVQRVNTLAGTHYEWVEIPTSDWRGLTIAILYDSARVKLEKSWQLSGPEVDDAFGPRASVGNRQPLVGVFSVGEGIPPITVIANKLKTRRREDSVFSLQPPVHFTEMQRQAQARVIRKFVDSLLEKDPNAYVAVTGDLGDYPFADEGEGTDYPLAILEGKGGKAPMTNLVNRVDEAYRYDFIFQGMGCVLSHTLVSPALLKAFVGADNLHFNTAFPEELKWDPSTPLRASDRDPLESRFNLVARKKR